MLFDDFYFNNKFVSDFGFVALSPEDTEISLGVSRELVQTELTPQRNSINIFGAKYVDTLPLEFLLIKNTCIYKSQDQLIISDEELAEIQSWLTSPKTARKLTISSDDINKEYYGMFTEVLPFEIGKLYGIRVVFKCNAPYGFSPCFSEIKCNGTARHTLINRTNELEEYTMPVITIHSPAAGTYSITNESDGGKVFSITTKKAYNELIIDCERECITGDGQCLSYSDVGWDLNEILDWNNVGTGTYKTEFLGLLPGQNILVFNGNADFELNYKIPIKTGGH